MRSDWPSAYMFWQNNFSVLWMLQSVCNECVIVIRCLNSHEIKLQSLVAVDAILYVKWPELNWDLLQSGCTKLWLDWTGPGQMEYFVYPCDTFLVLIRKRANRENLKQTLGETFCLTHSKCSNCLSLLEWEPFCNDMKLPEDERDAVCVAALKQGMTHCTA